jgi:predicted DNA-binding WGR domain protein
MTGMVWRRFERTRDGATEYCEISRTGIRCFLRWGSSARSGKASTSVLDDDAAAQRHVERKAREWLRKGYVEVAQRVVPDGDPDALVVPAVMAATTKAWFTPPEFLPVDGFADVVCQANVYPTSTNGFYQYLVLRDGGRAAINFNVRQVSHDPVAVAAFLDAVTADRDLAFDGLSHHKVKLPKPAGAFSHALFCSPALGHPMVAYPAIAARVALAVPIHDCEIGDADSEVLVDARLTGRDGLGYADWNRPPKPVIDLRYAYPRRTERTFKVYSRRDLARLLRDLSTGTPDTWLEVRSFHGEVKRLTPTEVTATTAADIDAFLLGA